MPIKIGWHVGLCYLGPLRCHYYTGSLWKWTSVNSIWFLNLVIAEFISIIAAPILHIIPYFGGHHINDADLQGSPLCVEAKYVCKHFLFYFFLTVISLDWWLCTWVIVWVKNKRTQSQDHLYACVDFHIGGSLPFALITLEVNLNRKLLKLLVIFAFMVGLLNVFVIIASSYLAIAGRVKQLTRKKQLRAFRVITVILTFFVCWLPLHVCHIYMAIATESKWFESVSLVFFACTQ